MEPHLAEHREQCLAVAAGSPVHVDPAGEAIKIPLGRLCMFAARIADLGVNAGLARDHPAHGRARVDLRVVVQRVVVECAVDQFDVETDRIAGTAVPIKRDAAKDSFLDACIAAGGKVLFYDVNVSCSQGIEIRATNVPECVGISCGQEGLATKNDRVFSSLQQQLKGSNFICSVNGGSTMREPSPMDVVPTISPNDELQTTENGNADGGMDFGVDAGNPTGSPTREESENSMSIGSNDSSGAGMISSSVFALGLVSVLFVIS